MLDFLGIEVHSRKMFIAHHYLLHVTAMKRNRNYSSIGTESLLQLRLISAQLLVHIPRVINIAPSIMLSQKVA